MDDGVAEAIALRCGVDTSLIVPMALEACPHVIEIMRTCTIPREIEHEAYTKRVAEQRVEEVYRREVLGAAAAPAAANGSTDSPAPLTDDEKAASVLKVPPPCTMCGDTFGDNSLLVLPMCNVLCRKHAQQVQWRDSPHDARLYVNPRGSFSSVWCVDCKRPVDWTEGTSRREAADGAYGKLYDVVKNFPIPKSVRNSAMYEALARDVTMGPCIEAACHVAAARAWCVLDKTHTESWGKVLSHTVGFFIPSTGLDFTSPLGVQSDASKALCDGLQTSFGNVPHAVCLSYDRPEDGTPRPAASAASDPERQFSVLSLEVSPTDTHGGNAEEAVFGYLLKYPEEEEDEEEDEDEEAEAEAEGTEPKAEPSLREQRGNLLAAKLKFIHSTWEGFYDFEPREVFDTMEDKWVPSIVVCRRSRAEAVVDESPDHYVPLSKLSEHLLSDAESLASDSESDSEEEAPSPEEMMLGMVPTEQPDRQARVSSWIRFFIDAFALARGIGSVGSLLKAQLEESEEDDDTQDSADNGDAKDRT